MNEDKGVALVEHSLRHLPIPLFDAFLEAGHSHLKIVSHVGMVPHHVTARIV